ncbi:MAG: MoxR family ATPase [Oscillospiraceae bacterium]|nr:MoxR family ATPase [Oscillospiraceae bacterium]
MNNEIRKIVDNVEKVIVGKIDVILKILTALISGGHVLVEDVPGVGKTQLVFAIAKSLDGKFNRIQLTPDVMPSDIVGFSMINPQTRELEYKEGIAICNFLLADEINRASPKAQSSLLEIMEEYQISLDGKTYQLPKPFMTLATQNPVETYGTYHLPEAQMDRFLMKISIGYPSREQEIEILNRKTTSNNVDLQPVMNISEIENMKIQAEKTFISDEIMNYILDIIDETRNSADFRLGASPRASIALVKASKAFAFVNGREFVTPDDVKSLAVNILSHRLILSPKGKAAYNTNEQAVEAILEKIKVPTTRN